MKISQIYNSNTIRSIKGKLIIIFIFIIVLLGGILRFYQLGESQFRKTEYITIKNIELNFVEMVDFRIRLGHSPLYCSIVEGITKIWSVSEFSTRFLSAIFGTFTVYILFLITNLMFNKKVALLASLLLAVNKYHIYYSQYARSNSIATFFALLSLYFFIKAIIRNKNYLWVGYVISISLALYFHNSTIQILLVQVFYFLLTLNKHKKDFIKKFFISMSIAVILYIPLFLCFLNNLQSCIRGLSWISIPDIYSIKKVFLKFIPHYVIISIFNYNIFFYPLLFFLGVGSIFLRSFTLKKASVRFVNRTTLLFLWLTIPVISFYICSIFFIPIFRHEYFLPVLTCYLVFIAYGIFSIINITTNFVRCPKKKIIKFVVYLGISIFISYLNIVSPRARANIINYYSSSNPQFKEAALYLKKKVKSGDKIILSSNIAVNFLSHYMNLHKKRIPIFFSTREISVKKGDIFWFILFKPYNKEGYEKDIKNYFKIEEVKELLRLKVYRLEVKKDKKKFQMYQIMK